MHQTTTLTKPTPINPPCFLCFSTNRKRKKIVFRTTQRRWVCKNCLNAFGGKNPITQILEKIPLAEDAIFPESKI